MRPRTSSSYLRNVTHFLVRNSITYEYLTHTVPYIIRNTRIFFRHPFYFSHYVCFFWFFKTGANEGGKKERKGREREKNNYLVNLFLLILIGEKLSFFVDFFRTYVHIFSALSSSIGDRCQIIRQYYVRKYIRTSLGMCPGKKRKNKKKKTISPTRRKSKQTRTTSSAIFFFVQLFDASSKRDKYVRLYTVHCTVYTYPSHLRLREKIVESRYVGTHTRTIRIYRVVPDETDVIYFIFLNY